MPQPHVREWRKLDEQQREAWTGFLRAHTAVVSEVDADLLARQQLNLNDYNVLLTLSATVDGWMRMSELADAVLLSRSGLTRLVDRLQGEGLVRRYSDDDDGRAVYASITARGVARLTVATRAHVAGVRSRFADRLSPAETRQLVRICRRLLED
jgi:DNA-binding MarR family transcriptional regulator